MRVLLPCFGLIFLALYIMILDYLSRHPLHCKCGPMRYTPKGDIDLAYWQANACESCKARYCKGI